MKRSEVNTILREADEFIRRHGFALPPFAHWSPDELRERAGPGILDARLGWDITDYGRGDFGALGLALFTLRNGSLADLKAGGGMCYAEKLLISREGQLSPMHRHVVKAEDIINRGGGTLVIEPYHSAPEGSVDRTRPVEVPCDGTLRRLAAGEKLRLAPGESVTLMPGVWHAFWGEGSDGGTGDVLIGEVSTVNDDETDNVFEDDLPRFAAIEEDEAPWRWLVSDYGGWGR